MSCVSEYGLLCFLCASACLYVYRDQESCALVYVLGDMCVGGVVYGHAWVFIVVCHEGMFTP